VLLHALNADITAAEAELAAVLPATPAGVLITLPGIAVVRASAYGAAWGDPCRFTGHAQAYRLAGLHPSTYDSAGTSRGGQRLSRRGSPDRGPRSSSSGKASPAVTRTSPPTNVSSSAGGCPR
jgi:transposase